MKMKKNLEQPVKVFVRPRKIATILKVRVTIFSPKNRLQQLFRRVLKVSLILLGRVIDEF